MGANKNHKFILGLIVSQFSAHANASPPQTYQSGVNIKDASYYIIANDTPKYVIMERNYSSRSLHRGYYGFGWCSILDYKLKFKSDTYIFDKCGIDYKLSASEVSRTNDGYKYKDYIFNSDGLPTKFSARGLTYQIIYRSKRLMRIAIGDTPIAHFTFDAQNTKIQKIIYNDKSQTHLQYENDLLTWTKTSKRGTHLFKYDKLNNLTHWQTSTGYTETINYDIINDRIAERKSLSCLEKFSFSPSADGLILKAESNKSCKTKTNASVGYIFHFHRNPTGERTLNSMQMQTGYGQFVVNYHPVTGKALNIRRITNEKNDADIRHQFGGRAEFR